MVDISVIIPVYNEESTIGKCLESVGGQTVKPKEIIVVDDKSTDGTLREIEIATAAAKRRPRNDMVVLRQEHRGAGAARNTGAAKATGDVLVFVDADMRFHPTFLEELTTPIREGKSKGTFSKQEYIANWNNIWARFWNYRRGIYEPIAVPKDFPRTSPVFRAILRREFQKVGGFDEHRGYNDDWSLSGKLRLRATETSARFYHENPSSLSDVFRQARWSAKRYYRHGWLGFLFALVRAFPLWAAPIGWLGIWKQKRRLAESTWSLLGFSLLFFLVVQIGVASGIIEFAVLKHPQK